MSEQEVKYEGRLRTIIDWRALAACFPAKDIEWRLQECGKKKDGSIWAMCLAYITNRAIMQRLDDVCGPANWRNEYAPGPHGGIICGLSIRCGDEWVTKWDGADNTQVEAVKGGLSDAMKRAGVQWGIGRYLYNLESGWADVTDRGKNRGKTKDGVNFKWDPPKLPSWALPSGSITKEPGKHQPTPPPSAPGPDYDAMAGKSVTAGWIGEMEGAAANCSVSLFRGWWPKMKDAVTADCGESGAAEVFAAWKKKGVELAEQARSK
jgi:hypothetical protein